MRVAITSQGNSLESKLDQRFGHCRFFVIYDMQTGSIEIIPNPYCNAEEQAGTLAVKLLSSKSVGKVVSGEFGIKAKSLFDSLGIQMIMYRNFNISIGDLIQMLNHKSK